MLKIDIFIKIIYETNANSCKIISAILMHGISSFLTVILSSFFVFFIWNIIESNLSNGLCYFMSLLFVVICIIFYVDKLKVNLIFYFFSILNKIPYSEVRKYQKSESGKIYLYDYDNEYLENVQNEIYLLHAKNNSAKYVLNRIKKIKS